MTGRTTEGTPQKIGKYRIDAVLGEGAMGIVYRGHDPDIDRVVAIKTVHTFLMSERERGSWLERFAREAKAAGRCMHPNLVTVFDYLEEGGAPFLVMECIEAETLADRIARPPLPSLAEIGSVMRQMLAGLGAAHAAGIVHRDVKPANVMLLPDGRLKLADFGVARVDALGKTAGGMIGTPSYMAPEQFRGATTDERSDLFSAGIILFELLTGRKPFASDSMSELSRLVMAGSFQPPSALVPSLPEGVDALLARALHPDPAKRFPSAAALADAVHGALGAAGLGTDDSDRTVIAPPAGGRAPGPAAGSALSRTLLDQLPASVFARIEGELIERFGPIGRVWVRKAAASTNDIERMIDSLARHIGEGAEADAFRASLRRQLEEGSGAGIRQDLLDELTRALTPYVGPIASVLVKRTAACVRSRDELCSSLAAHVADARERAEFLEKVG